jgi:UDP-N-acetylglucosamine:LPS N-acetylglucosamine transferase
LAGAISEVIADPERTRKMGAAAKSLATPEATKRIVDTIEKFI